MYRMLNSAAKLGQDFSAPPAIPSQPGPNSLGPVRTAGLGGSGPAKGRLIMFSYTPVIFSKIS